ncbi:SufD family Fe-S cluster assembly protein [Paracoccus sp. p4-l81]|uniref:SufB/SufD family protein n=1 Tax=Paracoccus sp. p4-l81 TaxID=3342806 RepID=UPI0035BA97D8
MALDDLKAGAQARLDAQGGLPTRRDEYWRYTDPRALLADEVPPAPLPPKDAEPPLFSTRDRFVMVFTDGVFDAEASDLTGAEGIEIAPLSAAPDWVAGFVGTLEAEGQKPVGRPLAALNGIRADEGAAIRVTGRIARPLHILYRRNSEACEVFLRHVVKLDPGAEVTILETGLPGARANTVMEIDLPKAARFHHIRAQGPGRQRLVATAIFARIGEAALFKSFTLAANGTLTRNEAVLDIQGDDAVAHVAGAALGDAATGNFHHDDTVFVTHAAERCESRQVFKKVLKNGAVGVFQGKILVKPGAQKTDGYQISQALLLDENSQFLGKPELEIYADDVKCSHGSTTGAIDPTALFYLRSRGVPEDAAVAMLVLSFLADAIDEIEDDDLKSEIVTRLEDWLNRHPAAPHRKG